MSAPTKVQRGVIGGGMGGATAAATAGTAAIGAAQHRTRAQAAQRGKIGFAHGLFFHCLNFYRLMEL
jgi:hypothetical protein